MTYRPGENVHWIQANKAVNDVDSWHAVDVCLFNLSTEPVPAPKAWSS